MNGKDKPIIRNLDKCELIDAIAKAKMMMDESETIEQMNTSLNYAALASSSFPDPLSVLSGFSANVQIIILAKVEDIRNKGKRYETKD